MLILQTWGIDSGPYMQALHFFFALGAIISPLTTAPFLKSDVVEVNMTEYTNHSDQVHNMTTSNLTFTFNSSTEICEHLYQEKQISNIHGAFVISALLTLLSGISFFYFCCVFRPERLDN